MSCSVLNHLECPTVIAWRVKVCVLFPGGTLQMSRLQDEWTSRHSINDWSFYKLCTPHSSRHRQTRPTLDQARNCAALSTGRLIIQLHNTYIKKTSDSFIANSKNSLYYCFMLINVLSFGHNSDHRHWVAQLQQFSYEWEIGLKFATLKLFC